MELTSPPTQTTSRVSGRQYYFPHVSDADWNDWTWQFRHRLTSIDELHALLPIPDKEWEARRQVLRDFRMGITPYYFSLIDPRDPDDPILRQVVPIHEEYLNRAVGDEDPLGEENFSPVPGITHRYPDRVLMVISNVCAVYCRYCTRKRIMYEEAVPDIEIDRMVDYIRRTPQVRDVVVSGGDPLNCSTSKLDRILGKLRAIPHLEIIRIGSRVPVANPMRVDDELCEMLQRHHPLWINVHFNHPRECTPEAARACDKLSRAGIPLNNQSVLLRGVNDDVATMRGLVHGLMKMRVRPYYLYHCDPVRGSDHMRTTIGRGLEILEGLRGHTSGLAIPTYVVDAPGGGGKMPLMPQYLLRYEPETGRAIFRNFQGKVYEYWERDPGNRGGSGGISAPARMPGNGQHNGNGNGHAPTNGNGNGSAHAGSNGNGNGSAPIVGKSGWVHSRNAPSEGGNGNGNGRP